MTVEKVWIQILGSRNTLEICVNKVQKNQPLKNHKEKYLCVGLWDLFFGRCISKNASKLNFIFQFGVN